MTDSRDERRIVTALFADVAGSTALAERLDAEEAKLVIGEAVSRAIRAVEAYGGTINNLMGDGFLALFGAPVAHEDDPERAVRAGLDILGSAREYAEEVSRSFGIEGFAMRVGIHSGEVVVGQVGSGGRVEYGVMGDTINTAARLEAVAGSGGILVSEITQRQVLAKFAWGDPRSLELKGKSETVTAFPVTGVREPGAIQPGEVTAPMVGRQSELGTALDLLERLASGRGAVLFIVGEPGIGKSRLTAEIRKRALSKAHFTWLEGRCVSYGESLPYWPYRDLLRNWLDISPTEPELRVRVKLRRKAEKAFPGRGSELYPYLATVLGLNLEPEAAAQLKPLSPESLQFQTFEVFSELLQYLATDRPVVVSLDDLHWADPTSLALTERLLALAEGAPIMLAVSQRQETEHASWQLKEKAAREYRHLFRELPLHPLEREPESQLLSSLAGHRSLPAEVTDRLLSYAEGNPFYLEQMLRSLIDNGTLVPENSHWTIRAGEILEIPQTLEGVIIARIDRLEQEWREVLMSASVLGRTFGPGLVEALTGLAMPAVRQAVHHLLRLDLLQEEFGGASPVYRFKHALIQEAAHRTLVATKRAILHRRAAEWYESYYSDRLERVYGLIAHHWLETDDRDKAARYLKLAGDHALAEWALDEAVGHYRTLIPLLERTKREQDAAETLFQLATALHLAMRYREANDTWQRAFDVWSPSPVSPQPATAALRFGGYPLPSHVDPAQAFYSHNERLLTQLYDALFELRPGPYVTPGLARRWQVSGDGRVYRVALIPDLTWNDGMPFKAADVVAGIKHMLTPATASTEASHLFVLENAADYQSGKLRDFSTVGVRTLNDETVEFRLRAPAPFFIFLLGIPAFTGAITGRTNGPFRLATMTHDRVLIERDPGYRRSRGGNVATVEWVPLAVDDVPRPIPERHVDAAAVSGGATHLLPAIKTLTTVMGPPLASQLLAFTGASQFKLDLAMRKALAHAIDRTALEPLAPNQSPAGGGLVPPGVPGHSPDIAIRFDLELARRFVKQSDHRGPVRIANSWQSAPYYKGLLDRWRAGLDLDIEDVRIPVSDIIRLAEIGHAGIFNWIAGYPDPEYFLGVLLHSRGTSNVSRWSSESLDRVIDRALAQESGQARMALFHEADRMAVQEECAVIPVIYFRGMALVQPWVHGWWEWGVPLLSYDGLTIDDRSPRGNGLD
jgi:class 3 adenylate cyclase/ABC-type transport system substrate-binding protein